MKSRWSFCALALFFCLCESAAAAVYEITNLGVLPGGTLSIAQSINNSGQVAGTVYMPGTASRAFLYSAGVMQDLGVDGQTSSRANAINNSGNVAGIVGSGFGFGGSGPSAMYAAFYDGAQHTIGNNRSGASGINDNNDVVGSQSSRAVLFKNGTIQDLGTLGTGTRSEAEAINSAGTIVGFSYINANDMHAFVYINDVMQDLGTLGGLNSRAWAINDANQITGSASTPGGNNHAFLYENGTMHDLGTLGGAGSIGFGMNNAGDIVGQSVIAGPVISHAFLYRNGVMQDLNSLIDPASGWVLTSAVDINEVGQIVGYGMINGEQRGFILTPVPEPSTYVLAAVGMVALLAIKRRKAQA